MNDFEIRKEKIKQKLFAAELEFEKIKQEGNNPGMYQRLGEARVKISEARKDYARLLYEIKQEQKKEGR